MAGGDVNQYLPMGGPINGNNYPQGFQGPVRPGQTIGGQNPFTTNVNQYLPMGQPINPSPQQQVLGVNTQTQNNQAPRQQQTQAPSNNGRDPHINPNTGVWDDNWFAQHFAQQAPQQPDFNAQYGNAFNSAFSALDQAQAARQAAYESQLQQLTGSKASTEKGLRSDADISNQQLDVETQKAQGQSKQAMLDLQQQQAEIQQGLLARYGTTTGTGQFMGEMAMRDYGRAYSQNQQNLQNHLAQLSVARNQIQSSLVNHLYDLEQKTQGLIAQAGADFQSDKAKIASQRGTLEVEKQDRIVSALNRYQQTIQDINNRNQETKTRIFTALQQIEAQSRQSAKSASANYLNNLEKLVQYGMINPSKFQAVEQSMNLPEGSLQQPGKNTSNQGSLTKDQLNQLSQDNVYNANQ